MMNSNLLMIVVAILLLASCKSNVNKTMNEVKEMVFMEEEEDEESNGEVINLNDYVDLGLPSGTHWKMENEGDFYNWNSAAYLFGKEHLPNEEQWYELMEYCKWSWNGNGYTVTGINGNYIDLPLAGYRESNGIIQQSGTHGYYWSNEYHTYNDKAIDVIIMDNDNKAVLEAPCSQKNSVRLILDFESAYILEFNRN